MCAQVHMCSCVHCYSMFLLCSMYVFRQKKNTLGIGEVVFFSPSYCLFLQLFLSVGGVVGPRCLCDRHVSSTPLAGVLPTDHQLRDLSNTSVSAPLFLLPPSLFPTLPSRFPRSSVLGFPHLQHIRVFMLQRYSRESS